MRITLAFLSAVLALAYAQDAPIVDDVAPELDGADLVEPMELDTMDLVMPEAAGADDTMDVAQPRLLSGNPLLLQMEDTAPPPTVIGNAPATGDVLPPPLKCCKPMPVEPCPKGLYGKCCGDGNWWCQKLGKMYGDVCDVQWSRRGTYNVCGDTVPTYRPMPTPAPTGYAPLPASIDDDDGAATLGSPDIDDAVPVVDSGAEDLPVDDDLADLVNNGQ